LPASNAIPAPDVSHGPALQWGDWLVRLALWAASVFAFARQIETLPALLGNAPLNSPLNTFPGESLPVNSLLGNPLLPLLLFALFMGAYLLASIAPVARRVYAVAQGAPLSMALAPLLLLIPYVFYARLNGTLELSDLLLAGVLLFLPTALVMINSPALRGADVSLGLISVALPLVAPLLRNQTINETNALLRVGAFALPVLLVLLTTRVQKQRLNFLFICAVLSLWYSVEFGAFPGFALPGQGATLSYFQLAVLPAFLYLLALAGRFGALGLSLQPSPRGLSIVITNLALFALIAIPFGLMTKFITPGFASPSPLSALGQLLSIYLFVALPEEILFRGALLRYLDDTLHWPQAAVVVLSALIFGAAHFDNPPNVGWYFVLASIAGVFYARTYLMTRNVGAAATLHALVDWIWALIFAG
jgi:membrane protease YdiL (CAAX protease family)